ncbi:MAG TPA: thiamine-phosphate kinase [Solimonas sp.]|nr:thiamine-phosphate kinase [Solimonas sp.]
MDEFELIRRYFSKLTPPDRNLRLGIGDDCALVEAPAGQELAITTDTFVAGRHFPERTAPADIGWKALAVNLSDLAAMGAEPRWFTLALTLPSADAEWLRGFAGGLGELAALHRVTLIGGDTTRGRLSITITAMGVVPKGQALRRSGARPGDAVCVTGTLGDAALGLKRWRRLGGKVSLPEDAWLIGRLARPTPRVAAGLALRGLARAAIDISDGLIGDLGHIAQASGVGAILRSAELPASPAFDRSARVPQRLALQAAAGDDYELCVCLAPAKIREARQRLAQHGLALSHIGEITAGKGVRIVDAQGAVVALDTRAYRHFE